VTERRSFEELQRELEEIVRKLEQGDVPVDDAVALWQRGEALYRECAGRLEAVELRVEELGHTGGGDTAPDQE
jgi:exodeoxyribonuclease VII small subunit